MQDQDLKHTTTLADSESRRLSFSASSALVAEDEIISGNTPLSSDENTSLEDVPFVYYKPGHVPFRHIKELGRGSFAIVDEVEAIQGDSDNPPLPVDIRKGNLFARKVVRISRDQKTNTIMHELQALKKLKHEHVVGVKLAYEELRKGPWENKTFGLIMTPIADCTLKDFFELRDSGYDRVDWDRPSIDRIKEWVGCLASGLAYIHGQGVIHKDIKPANILITNGHVRYADFGIARTITSDDTESQTYGFPGPRTVLYCAPEVALWQHRGRKADVFSLGCVFVEMITISQRLPLEQFSKWRETGGRCAYHLTLNKTLRWLFHLREGALDRVSYCIAMLDPNPAMRISSEKLARWISCHRDYSSFYRGNRGCRSLGNSPVGEFWTICLHGNPPWDRAFDLAVDISWDAIRSRWLTKYKWNQTDRLNFPVLQEVIAPTSVNYFQPATDWRSFRHVICG